MKTILKIIGVLLLLISLVFLFTTNKRPPVSFYYWKQTYTINKQQQQLLHTTKSQKIYVKLFDVVIENNELTPKPISIIQFIEHPKLNVIPCVYIQNKVFKVEEAEKLADNVLKLITKIASKNKLAIHEIQIDCDWSNSTKDRYFNFLRHLQKQKKRIEITNTIRLHQIKYQSKTGVPPVKKGVLMCYNMDDIDQFETHNSIISLNTLKQYVNSSTDYPIALDLALPIYQWGLVFRLGKLSVIANGISKHDLSNSNFSEIKPTIFRANKNCYINETHVCKGDLIRLETSSPQTLIHSVNYLNESKLSFNQLILFHISQQYISPYNGKFIKKINSLIP